MILIIDFGSQFTQLIARRVREMDVYAEIVPFHQIQNKSVQNNPPQNKLLSFSNIEGIILSGGPQSVYDENAPKIALTDLPSDLPILGICYGLQLLNILFGGTVAQASTREYGFQHIHSATRDRTELPTASTPLSISTPISSPTPSPLLHSLFNHSNSPDNNIVWMSHGDEILKLAPDFEVEARTATGSIAAFHHTSKPIFGLQFHPEVEHSPCGRAVLRTFVLNSCGAKPLWKSQSIVKKLVDKIRQDCDALGEDSQILCALSGGVDSCVAATLVERAVGNRLTCLFIDNGFLRKNEFSEVQETLRERLKLNVRGVDASRVFLERLTGVTDPEEKRKRIGRTFIEVFERESKKLPRVRGLVQGTLYTDVIESVPVYGSSVVIKSHHNVGGLPEKMNLVLVEPLRELFKDEVRKIGQELGIPNEILMRHPFPGPGLAIRILGEVTSARLNILREADSVLVDELKKSGQYGNVWQAFVVLLPVQSVGVMGDGRTYESVAAIRCVDAVDGMTADWSKIPYDILARISSRIVNEVRGINRVVYDVTSKPPATIEWE